MFDPKKKHSYAVTAVVAVSICYTFEVEIIMKK